MMHASDARRGGQSFAVDAIKPMAGRGADEVIE
jgi:hypothetical protein